MSYLVNGGINPPDWLAKTAKKHKNRALISQDATNGVRLIQDSDFPEASQCIKTSRDGKYLVATGTYKPRIKVLDLAELTQKFERITDAETIDFDLLSDDWTKSVHVQSNRTIELHDQRASFYRTRIPTPGRCIAYHFQTCDALVGAQGGHVCRLNLEQGRFLAPFALEGSAPVSTEEVAAPQIGKDDEATVTGVNCIDINQAHQMLAFGTETVAGKGTVEFWDHRSRQRVGVLTLPYARIAAMSGSAADRPLSTLDGDEEASRESAGIAVTALASRFDGLNLAVGTSTGQTLLYDMRSSRPYAIKDQGYGLPIRRLQWPTTNVSGGDFPLVASADRQVVKIWSASSETPNIVSINPPAPVNEMHIVPSTGLLWLANEASPLTAYYVPSLGPAPTWCRFLDNMTEEMEEGGGPSVYDDYKFIDRQELRTLNLDHLIGTTALRPYMHGFFVDLRLYTKARAIANPFQYAEYRDRQVAAKLDAERDSRIRTSRAEDNHRLKVNAALVERLQARDEARSEATSGRKRKREKERQIEGQGAAEALLGDDRFSRMFEEKDFEVDTTSREFALLNPSMPANLRKEESLAIHEASDAEDSDEQESDEATQTDSSAEGDLLGSSARAAAKAARPRRDLTTIDNQPERIAQTVTAPVMRIEKAANTPTSLATIGQRHKESAQRFKPSTMDLTPGEPVARDHAGGGRELSFVPDPAYAAKEKAERKAALKAARREKAEKEATLGAGLRKGSGKAKHGKQLEGEDASGRARRRKASRSASKTQMRKLSSR